MPEPEKKMRKCRACGKDVEVGKPCDNEGCGYDEDAEKLAAKKRRLDKQLDDELEQEEKKKQPKPDDKKTFLPFRR